jgi:hypothetical protein
MQQFQGPVLHWRRILYYLWVLYGLNEYFDEA